MEALQAQVDRLTKLITLGGAPEHELSMLRRLEIIDATLGNQERTMEEFRGNGNQLQVEMQAQINQMKQQIDLLNNNMSNVHVKIDMGLIASQGNMNRNLMESKAINNLPVFGGTEKESFKEWSYTLACVMEQLKPGTREVLQKIDTTKETEWASLVHHEQFTQI